MADDNAYSQAINKALSSAKSMLGKNEVPDREDIQSYLHDGGQDLDPHKLAWCAAFVSASLQKAGLPIPTQVVKDSAFGPGAYAGNYKTYGSAVDPKNVQAGDILVANDGSHVGFAEGPIRQGPNGPEVQLLAGNEKDASGQYAPGSYTNPKTGAVANRAQVGMVGERWVPLSQYSARRYQAPNDASQPAVAPQPPGTTITSAPVPTSGAPAGALAAPVTASTPFSLSPPGSSIPSAGQFQPLIDAAAKKYNLDPNFLGRLLWQENRFRPAGTSSAGAQGIAQFMPATAKRYGVDVNDPASSIEGAAHYLSDLSGRYSGNLGLAAAGYNWGEGNVDKWLQGRGKPPSETTNYVNTITGHSMDEWRADPKLPLGSGGPGRSPSGPATPAATPAVAAAPPADQPVWSRFVNPPVDAQGKPVEGAKSPLEQAVATITGGPSEKTTEALKAAAPQRSALEMGAPGARNVSLGLAPGAAQQVWGQTLNSFMQPLTWGSAPPGTGMGPVAGYQGYHPAGAAPAVPGTSLASVPYSALDPNFGAGFQFGG